MGSWGWTHPSIICATPDIPSLSSASTRPTRWSWWPTEPPLPHDPPWATPTNRATAPLCPFSPHPPGIPPLHNLITNVFSHLELRIPWPTTRSRHQTDGLLIHRPATKPRPEDAIYYAVKKYYFLVFNHHPSHKCFSLYFFHDTKKYYFVNFNL